jgi:hypothetical protein
VPVALAVLAGVTLACGCQRHQTTVEGSVAGGEQLPFVGEMTVVNVGFLAYMC